MTRTLNEPGLDDVAEIAAQLRVDSVRSSTSAGSGHPTSSMSAADILAVLVSRHPRYDRDRPASPADGPVPEHPRATRPFLPAYSPGSSAATRKAFGEALVARGAALLVRGR